jgi:arginine decarboxylase
MGRRLFFYCRERRHDGHAGTRRGHRAVSIAAISGGIRERGFDMPVLLRIENILDAQITSLNETFRSAMVELGYTGAFMGAYPIKVNQQQQVVEKITQFGSRYHHGLEAGSKAELIAAMGMMRDKKAVLICNGYKDEEFIDLGLYATKIGFTCILVVEMPDELPLIIERSKKLQAKPILGIRIKLSAQAGGHWSESGGERSIFGLNTNQIIQAVDLLASAGMLDCLQTGPLPPGLADLQYPRDPHRGQRGLPGLCRSGQGRGPG